MYFPANKGFIWLIFYKPFYEYMNGQISLVAMLRRMAIRWTVLAGFAIFMFVWFFNSENPGRDLNMPAMVTEKQWSDMKERKAAGLPIQRPLGPNDAQWANVLDHLAIVPGPPTIASPAVFIKSRGGAARTIAEHQEEIRAEEEERKALSVPVPIPGHKSVPFPKEAPSFFEQLRQQWQITQKQKSEGR